MVSTYIAMMEIESASSQEDLAESERKSKVKHGSSRNN